MASRKELGTRLAIITAAEKAIKAAKEEVRSEARAMMREAYEEDGISSLDLLIGTTKVGRVGVSKPAVGIYGGSVFANWAVDNNMGSKTMTIDLTGVPQEQLNELVDLVVGEGYPYRFDCRADDYAKRALEVKNGHVVDQNGEIVPGTYVKAKDIRVTGCKPEDVGEAMRALGDTTTIAGLLAPQGGDE